MVPRPEGTRRSPKVRVPGSHSRGVCEDEVAAREPALPGFTAGRLPRRTWGAVAWVWRRQEPTFPQTLWLPTSGLSLEGQFSSLQASDSIPPGADPPSVQRCLPGALAQRAARVGVVTRPGVTVPCPGAPGEDARVLPEGGLFPRFKGLPGAPERGLLIDALFSTSEIAPPGREPLPAFQGKGLVEMVAERLDVAHIPGFRRPMPEAGISGFPPQPPDLGDDERDRAPGLPWG